MKQLIAESEPRAENRGGDEAGAPLNSGDTSAAAELPPSHKSNAIGASSPQLPVSDAPPPAPPPAPSEALPPQPAEGPTEFDGASTSAEWVEQLRRRANQPLVMSDEYDRAIAACVAELEARKKRKPGNYALSSAEIEWNRRMVLLIIWLVLTAVFCFAAM